jgi:hypothetical protein
MNVRSPHGAALRAPNRPCASLARCGSAVAEPLQLSLKTDVSNITNITCILKRRRAYGSSGIEVAAVTSIVLTNKAATIVEKLRKVSALIISTP